MPELTREELYDLVWSEPIRSIAPRFGMSDVGFKKHCVAAHVPVPQRGYWAKHAAGKRVAKVPLPLREPGAAQSFTIGGDRYRWQPDPEKRLAEPIPVEPTFPEALEAVRARVGRRLNKVRFERDLSSPHAGLRKLLETDARRVAAVQKNAWAWDKPLFESAFERRRLRLLNSLAIGLARLGARLDVSGKTGRDVSVAVGHTAVAIALDHPKAKPNRHGEWEVRDATAAEPVQLMIAAKDGRSPYPVFHDDEDGRLESRLTAIALEIIVAGEAEYRRRQREYHAWLLAQRREWEEQAAKNQAEAERQARERRLAEEKARREQLFAQAQAWRTARDIRGFVAEVLAEPKAAAPDQLRAWADWALAEADALDPVNGGLTPPASAGS